MSERQAHRSEKEQLGTFKAVLRRAIHQEYGKAEEFAKALGITPGRISQILNGPEELKNSTLEPILAALSPASGERVRAAWIREFVPDVGTEPVPPSVAAYKAYVLDSGGLPRKALKLIERTIAEAAPDDEARPLLLQRAAEYELKLDRPGRSMRRVEQASRLAELRNEPFDIFTALWLRGVIVQHLDVSQEEKVSASKDASDYGASHSEGSSRWRSRSVEATRDEALAILAAFDDGAVGVEELGRAHQLAKDAVESSDTLLLLPVALEIRARIECAVGLIAAAEESLDAAEESACRDPDMDRKAGLLRARILVARKQFGEAEEAYLRLSSEARTAGDLYRQRKAEGLLGRLLARSARPRFV